MSWKERSGNPNSPPTPPRRMLMSAMSEMKAMSIAPTVSAICNPSRVPEAMASMVLRCLDSPSSLPAGLVHAGGPQGLRFCGFRDDDLAHHDAGRAGHEGGRDQVVEPDAEQRVTYEQRPRHGREPGPHHGEELGFARPRYVRFDDEWRLGHPDKDCRGGVRGLGLARAQRELQCPADELDDPLQNSQVVEHRGEGGKEDDHRQDLEREDQPFLR